MIAAQVALDLLFVAGAGAVCSVPVAILIGTVLGMRRMGAALPRAEYASTYPGAWQGHTCHLCGGAPLPAVGLLVPDDTLRVVRCGQCATALYHFREKATPAPA